jgi:thymidine kinase
VAHNYEEKGMKVIVIKPSIDTKGEEKVTSRLGIERKVDVLLGPDEGVMEHMVAYKPNAIIIDEAQFLTKDQVDELYTMTKVFDVPVLAYGLRCDFQMKGFPGASRLLELADDIEELKTICRCGKKATQNVRLINGMPVFEGNQVAIDGAENTTYDSVCGECYIKLRRHNG